jgi:hypothetical protein
MKAGTKKAGATKVGTKKSGAQKSGITKRASKTLTSASAEKQLASFITKFEPAHQSLIRSVRKVLRKRLPTANEVVYDNYNFFVIGYCATERSSDCIVSIAAAANGVSLSFYYGAGVPDPHKLLLGSGNQNRFIRLESVKVLSDPRVEALIAAAVAQAKTPLPGSGNRKLIIRSVAGKQRQRRKAKH